MFLPPHRVDYSPIIHRPTITWPNNAMKRGPGVGASCASPCIHIRYLDTALGTMMSRHGAWAASGSRIIDWY